MHTNMKVVDLVAGTSFRPSFKIRRNQHLSEPPNLPSPRNFECLLSSSLRASWVEHPLPSKWPKQFPAGINRATLSLHLLKVHLDIISMKKSRSCLRRRLHLRKIELSKFPRADPFLAKPLSPLNSISAVLCSDALLLGESSGSGQRS